MRNKKEQAKLISVRITPIDLSEKELKRLFPTGNNGYPCEDFAIVHGDVIYGYVQVDYPDPTYSGIHLHVLPECRTKEHFDVLIKGFSSVMLPYLKDKGVKYIAGACALGDTKVLRIFESFGFDVKIVGTIKI